MMRLLGAGLKSAACGADARWCGGAGRVGTVSLPAGRPDRHRQDHYFPGACKDGASNIGELRYVHDCPHQRASAPGTPTFSAITMTMTSATMSWMAASDHVGVTGYRYQINAGAWQTLGNIPTVGLTGLVATTYDLD